LLVLALFESAMDVLKLALCSLLVLADSLAALLADADVLAALSLSDFSVLSDRIRDSLTTLLVLALFESAMDVLKLALCSLLVLADSLAALLADADVLAALSLSDFFVLSD
jgi:ketopantoate hydroxymethyltransferase